MTMEKSALEKAIEQMNRWGKERKPFLFIFDYELQQPVVMSLEMATGNGIFFTFDNRTNAPLNHFSEREFTFRKFPVPYTVFKKSFDQVVNEIQLGNSFLTNLTFPTPIETDLTLSEIFHRSKAPYKLLYKNQFVLFSPESFIEIRKGIIASYPMKGTIDASIPEAETKILNDTKETAEHHTIVDLIRNDLSMVATNVKVERFRFLTRVKSREQELLQVSSEITGELPDDYLSHLGDIMMRLLPAGSICGAPKKRTLEIIRQSEIYQRGYYSGVFGVFDGEELHSAVMIRFIEKQADRYIFKSGGGITALSDPIKEYQELIDKIYVPVY